MIPFAFVFPGQGSQSVGMLDAWGDDATVQETLEQASDALGEDMAALLHAGPEERLGLTVNTQPAMLTAGVACWRAWQVRTGLQPVAVAGHSLGEYAALVAADVLRLEDALPLVRLRAQAMQDAVPVGQGGMAAILGLEAEAVRAGCAQVSAESAGGVVEAVNFNTPEQTVIAGSREAVEKACEYFKAQGAKRALVLPVSAPFHSRLMEPAARRLQAALAETAMTRPKFPVVNNVDVRVEDDPDRIRDALYRQAFGPVRWVEGVRRLAELGAATVVECGPGRVLAGMMRRIDRALAGGAVYDPESLKTVFETLKSTVQEDS